MPLTVEENTELKTLAVAIGDRALNTGVWRMIGTPEEQTEANQELFTAMNNLYEFCERLKNSDASSQSTQAVSDETDSTTGNSSSSD